MIWTKSEKQLKGFMTERNQKHPSVKFDYKFDCKEMEFLDTLVYIGKQNKLQATQFHKSSDHQNSLNAKSEHSYSLKKSIPGSQALRIRRICSTFQDAVILGNLLNNLLIKDTKKMSSCSKFRRLTISIENNCSTNKNVMIKKAYHHQLHIVDLYQI